MKVSKYTFTFKTNDEYYLYNSLSNALIEIDKESFLTIDNCLNNNNDIIADDFDTDLFHELKKQGFITENDIDDFLLYKSVIMRQRNENSSMHLTIAPTMDCCFHCHYCFEKSKSPIYMSEGIMDSIVNYIMHKKGLENIRITWFGGEPLMAVPQMEMFYNKLKNSFTGKIVSNIITTGFHINENVIDVFHKLGITEIQITLDGQEKTHNKVKKTKGTENVYQKVMENIGLLVKKASDIRTTIRVNLTKQNADEYVGLVHEINSRFHGAKNLSVAPAFVLNRGSNRNHIESEDSYFFDHKSRNQFILELFNKYKLDSPYIRYPQKFFTECAIRNESAISFDPEGYMYKCWENIGDKKIAIGRLNEKGELVDVNPFQINRQLYGADIFDDPVCVECKYLPICNGGCPIQRLENLFENKKNNCCTYFKNNLIDYLKIHILLNKNGYRNRL